MSKYSFFADPDSSEEEDDEEEEEVEKEPETPPPKSAPKYSFFADDDDDDDEDEDDDDDEDDEVEPEKPAEKTTGQSQPSYSFFAQDDNEEPEKPPEKPQTSSYSFFAQDDEPEKPTEKALEEKFDKLIKETDDADNGSPRQSVSKGSGPVTSYQDVFNPSDKNSSGDATRTNLFEAPDTTQFSFQSLSNKWKEKFDHQEGPVKRNFRVPAKKKDEPKPLETPQPDVVMTEKPIFMQEEKEKISEDSHESPAAITATTAQAKTLEESEEINAELAEDNQQSFDEEVMDDEQIVFEKVEKVDGNLVDDEDERDRVVQFEGLPDNPPELTVESMAKEENNDDEETGEESIDNEFDYEEVEVFEVESSEAPDDQNDIEVLQENEYLDNDLNSESFPGVPPIPNEISNDHGDQENSDYDEELEYNGSASTTVEEESTVEKEALNSFSVSPTGFFPRGSMSNNNAKIQDFYSSQLPVQNNTLHEMTIEPRTTQSGRSPTDKKQGDSRSESSSSEDSDKSEDEVSILEMENGDYRPQYRPPVGGHGQNSAKNLLKFGSSAKSFRKSIRNKRNCLMLIFTLCCITLLAAVVVPGTLSRIDNERLPSTSIPIMTPAPTPTFVTPAPTPRFTMPPFTTQPPERPPILNPTRRPTLGPTSPPPTTLTAPPTTLTAPTVPPTPQRPENDVCSSAVGPLLPNGAPTVGSVAEATTSFVDRCGDIDSNGPGVWYYTFGTGGEMLAHTCLGAEFDSKITIFKGDCDKPLCLEGNDNFCGPSGLLSAVSWQTDYQQEYRILVHADPLFGSPNGFFELTLVSRYNDECTSAIGPLAVHTFGSGSAIAGDTLSANPNDFVCDGVTNISPSVYYLVRGTGGIMEASTCEGSDFRSRVSILTGSCPSDLECITRTFFNECSVSWDSNAFQDYYVVIHGDTEDDTGNFELQVTTTEIPRNDQCNTALGPLQLDGTVVQGTTAGAGIDSDAPFCLNAITSSGVWYYAIGNGATLQASLCNGSSFDTRISIYEGDCSAGRLDTLICVDGNDDFCGTDSLVTWPSIFGRTYFILVHGYQRGVGDFKLSVTTIQ